MPRLDELERRGTANEVPGLRRLGADEIAEIEPHARGLAALHSPAHRRRRLPRGRRGFAEDVRAGRRLGRDRPRGQGAARIGRLGRDRRAPRRRRETIEAGYAVLCAGAWADKLAVAAGAPDDPRIVPFRGGYLSCGPSATRWSAPTSTRSPTRTCPSSAPTSPAPTPARSCSGRRPLLTGGLGWPGTWRVMGRFWRTGAHRDAPRRQQALVRRGGASASSRSCGRRLRRRARRASAPRRSAATARWSTTSSSTRPSGRCTSATPPPPRRPPPSPLARLIADRVDEAGGA